MKKICMVIGIVIALFVAGIYMGKQNSSPDCVSSINSNGDYYLTIIANQRKIEDKEVFANQIIE